MTALRTVPARNRRPDAAARVQALSISLQEEFCTPFSFYDGSTGELGLEGEAIPLMARILAVADCYDAMNTARPYRSPVPRDQIEATLTLGRDRQWDGEVVDAFFRSRDRIHAIQPRGVGDSVWFALHPPERGFRPHFPSR